MDSLEIVGKVGKVRSLGDRKDQSCFQATCGTPFPQLLDKFKNQTKNLFSRSKSLFSGTKNLFGEASALWVVLYLFMGGTSLREVLNLFPC